MSIGDSEEGTRRECVYSGNSVLCCAKGPLALREPVVAVSVATAPAASTLKRAYVQAAPVPAPRDSSIVQGAPTITITRTIRRIARREKARRTTRRSNWNKENWITKYSPRRNKNFFQYVRRRDLLIRFTTTTSSLSFRKVHHWRPPAFFLVCACSWEIESLQRGERAQSRVTTKISNQVTNIYENNLVDIRVFVCLCCVRITVYLIFMLYSLYSFLREKIDRN